MKHVIDADLSALMDNHLDAGHAHDAMARLLASGDAQATWHCYHLIGDIIRSQELAPCASELGFAQKVMESLGDQSEATYLPAGSEAVAQTVVAQKTPSANRSQFRIKAFAGAIGVFFVAYLLVGTLQQRSEPAAPQIVAIQKQNMTEPGGLAVVEDRPVINRDPELDALLSAHEQMGGHSALQTPSGFLRNATFDRSKR
jgi:sigma-E factor negative regulatory protein RseA